MSEIVETEVIVVGAGLVGLTTAIALSQQGKRVVLVDAYPAPQQLGLAWDARIYALTELTLTWLKSLGIWCHVDVSRINAISAMHLWGPDDTQPLMLSAEDAHLSQMGWIIESQNLIHACWQVVKQLPVDCVVGECLAIEDQPTKTVLKLDNGQRIEAKLLVGADGGQSWVRQFKKIPIKQKSFDQLAIVANYQTQPHGNVARQWFGAHETVALLPLANQHASLVWALPTQQAQVLLAETSECFSNALLKRTEGVLGRLTEVTPRQAFGLHQQTALDLVAHRVVLVGDAAHQVHPMAGQGVNLGFKDVMDLAAIFSNLSVYEDIGSLSILRRYARGRKMDILEMNTLTSGLNAIFAVEQKWVARGLHAGMQLVNRSPLLKKQLIQVATF